MPALRPRKEALRDYFVNSHDAATPNQNYAVDTVRKQINVAAHEKAESGSEPCWKESCDDEENTLSLILAPNASRRAA